MAYCRVQFIAYEIYTGPSVRKGPERYVGVMPVATDVAERVALMKEAIQCAVNSPLIDKRNGTLKIFMAPEFYFRGPEGAYDMPVVLGDRNDQGSLLMRLTELTRWHDDWMFVFGTVVASSRRDSKNRLLDWLPDWAPFSKAWRDWYREVYNICIVQLGGWRNERGRQAKCRVVMKEYQSPIDFLGSPPSGLRDSQVSHLGGATASGPGKENQQTVGEGASIFTLSQVTFGLEICLDHAEQRLRKSPPKKGEPQLQVQLIPSGGMTIENDSIAVAAGGVVLHCDGNISTRGGGSGHHSQAIRVRVANPMNRGMWETVAAAGPTLRPHANQAAVRRLFAVPMVPQIRIYETTAIPLERRTH